LKAAKSVRPVRLRLSRRTGYRLQELSQRTNGLEAVKVTRPGKWSNPFHIADFGRGKAIALHREDLLRRLLEGLDLSELGGKNLACWCQPGELCHADTLLELANLCHHDSRK
jgi:hypothetical protein